MRQSKVGFAPIKIKDYIQLHVKSNPQTSREEMESSLQKALADYKADKKCTCGDPIWVIGSAVAGNACFTCITGEAMPDNDYEIDEALQ